MHSETSEPESIIRIRHYEIKYEISRGGMGVVYLAEDTKLARNVAIKVILNTSKTIFYKRFQREAIMYASLSHPNIVKIYDFGMYQNKPYIIMEYIQGKPILQYIESLQHEHVNYREHANLISQIAQAVHYIHQKNIIHRDIKSDNILVKEDGTPVLIDFGIAKDFSKEKSQAKLTQTGSILGSINIMSPEQALGKKVDYRTDIYSLGTVLYQLCTGQYPFDMSDAYSTLYAITSDQPITPSTIKPDIPESFDQIILRCLEKKPENRYKTAQHLANDLKQFFYQKDTTNTLYGLQLKYKTKRKKMFFILSSFIFIMCIAGLYFFLKQIDTPPKTTVDLSMIIPWENTFSQLQTQFSMHKDNIQEACHEPSIYTNLFKNITESTQYENTKNNERYLHNLEQRLQQTPWDATLYKDSMFLLTEIAKMHFENHENAKAKEYQKKAEEKLRKYFSIQPYDKKIFTKFAESYMYILDSSTLPRNLYISQELINASMLSLDSIEFSDLFPYKEICTTYLKKEKSTWNKDKFDVCKKLFHNKAHNILLQKILIPLLLSPEFCKLYQEDKEIRQLFQQEREQAIQNQDIQKPIKQLLAQYYLTRDTSYLSYIFTYTPKYISTLHHILNQDQEYFFRFLAAYALSICKEEKARNALKETIENRINNLDSALLSYICAEKMDLKIEYPDFLNVVPTEIAYTTKLIFLQYLLDISNKDKIRDSMHKYISTYIQDKNPNISLLAIYFMLKTMKTIPKEELNTNFLEYKIKYKKNIQQVWKIIKTHNEKHILLFIILANKFSDVIKLLDAMDKNVIIDIYSILEQTQNLAIQENALKFLQHYSEDKYENIARTWVQKEYLDESVKLFLTFSIDNNQNDLLNILKDKNIFLFSKILFIQSMIIEKIKFFHQAKHPNNQGFVLLGTLISYIKMIDEFIFKKNIDNKSKPFFVYILAALPNVSMLLDIKRKLLNSKNEIDQSSFLLGLGSLPFFGQHNGSTSFLKTTKKLGKVKKKLGRTNNQAMFQEDIKNKLKTASKRIQPYVAYAHVMMESYEKMEALPKLTCFSTKEQKWGAFYGYKNILYYDFPDLPLQWNLQKKYEKFLQQLYMILQKSVGITLEDYRVSTKALYSFPIQQTKKNLQNFIDALTYSIQIAPEIADIAPEIAGSMNSIYDSVLLQRYLERAIVYLVASQKYRDKEKADYALNDIEFVIQHDKTTRILQKYYALILYNALQYKEENKDIDKKVDKDKVKEQLEYAKILYPWDEDIIQAYNNIEKRKNISPEYKDIDWIFPQY